MSALVRDLAEVVTRREKKVKIFAEQRSLIKATVFHDLIIGHDITLIFKKVHVNLEIIYTYIHVSPSLLNQSVSI